MSAKNCSSPLDEAAQIKSWFDTVKERKISNLLTDKTVAICRARYDSGVMRLYTIKELEDSAVCGDYWMKGRLSIVNEEQKLFYIACSRCYTKINISEDRLHYFCWVCKKETVSTLRLLVQACVADSTGVMKVSCIDAVAEQVLDTNPADFARTIRLRNSYDLDARRMAFGENQYTLLLRRNYGKRYDEKRRMLLVDYTEEPLPVAELQTAATHVGDQASTGSVRVDANALACSSGGVHAGKRACPSTPASGNNNRKRQAVASAGGSATDENTSARAGPCADVP